MSLSLADIQREQPRQVPLANWQDVLQAELNAFDTASSTVSGIGDVAKTINFAIDRFHIARNTDNVLTFRTLNDTYILDVIWWVGVVTIVGATLSRFSIASPYRRR
ncbi:MAG: hypothetical protein ACLT1C_02830 [Weissella confusa]